MELSLPVEKATSRLPQIKSIMENCQLQLASATKSGDKDSIARLTDIIARGQEYLAALSPDKYQSRDASYDSAFADVKATCDKAGK